MPSALNSLTRLAHYGNDLIILTISDNKFHLIKDVPIESVNTILCQPGKNSHSPLYAALSSMGVMEESLHFNKEDLPSTQSTDYVEQRWMTPLSSVVRPSFIDQIKALCALFRAAFRVRFGGFRGVAAIQVNTNKDATRSSNFDCALSKAIDSLNRVFFLDFSGNKCLTYSLALTLLLRKSISGIRLVIGVRTRPFMSHAWVEHDKRVINDDPNLRAKLAIILEL